MMASLDAFDVASVSESCWQQCDLNPGVHPVDLNSLPVYRDLGSRNAFFEVATFFGCVDICHAGYATKRTVVIAGAIALAAALAVSALLSFLCCFSKRPKMAEQSKERSCSSVEEDISCVDLDASQRSSVSVNSWVGRSESSRQRFIKTATKLGRKLAALDRRAESQTRRRDEIRRASRDRIDNQSGRKDNNRSGGNNDNNRSGGNNSGNNSSKVSYIGKREERRGRNNKGNISGNNSNSGKIGQLAKKRVSYAQDNRERF